MGVQIEHDEMPDISYLKLNWTKLA